MGLASGAVLGSLAGTASAAPQVNDVVAGAGGQVDGPVVAHLSDVRTGAVDLFVGERHVQVHNSALATALARAAAADG